MKWLLKSSYTVDGLVNVFLRSNITLLVLTIIILIHLLYFTIQENWFYVLLLVMVAFVSNYIFSTGSLALLISLLTAYLVMIVRDDGFPDFFQEDLEGFKRKRRRRRRPKRRKFKKPKVKKPKVKNVVKSVTKFAKKNNLKRKAVNMLKKYGKYTPHGQALLFLMRKDAERRKKKREEKRRRAEERRKREEERRRREEEERRRREEEKRKREQAARDTVFRRQTKDAFDKTNYEINRRKIEFQIQERERIRRERINKDLGKNIPDDAINRSNETKEFINGIQVF